MSHLPIFVSCNIFHRVIIFCDDKNLLFWQSTTKHSQFLWTSYDWSKLLSFYWSPPIIVWPQVPPLIFVCFSIELISCKFNLFFLRNLSWQTGIVSRSEGINITNICFWKYFVIYVWRKSVSTESKSDVTIDSCLQ